MTDNYFLEEKEPNRRLAFRQQQIIAFRNSDEFRKLDAYYSQPSFFGALNSSRRENAHSDFLAWLLNPESERNDHKLGDFPLRKFLETLVRACSLPRCRVKLKPELANAITAGDYSLSRVKVEREKVIETGRLDIYIECIISFNDTDYPLVIVIENKVNSTEHDSQTKRYSEALESSVSSPGILLSVYLAPLPNREYERSDKPLCESEKFIELNFEFIG